MKKTYLNINKKNLIHNLKEFYRITKKPLIFVVKGNAYGHGLREVISITKDLNFIEYYAVDSLDEGLLIKKEGSKKKILILGWGTKEEIKEFIINDFEMVISSLPYLDLVKTLAEELKKPARIQIKIETGTARLGMFPKEVLGFINKKKEDPWVKITGVYSHFANIEDTICHDYAKTQLQIFNDFLSKIKSKDILKHFSCSAASLLFPETYFDMVRIGISAYGLWPSKETYISYFALDKEKINLKPVLSWYSYIAQIKNLKKGRGIGYGITYTTFAPVKMAIVPIGYYDGYDRALSNNSTVLVNGIRAPLRGRVCMNMIIIDVTHIKEISEGDEVVLIGQMGDEKITADYLAEISSTINYEIVCRINPKIQRFIR